MGKAHPKDGNAADKGGVLGRRQGVIRRRDEALGRATAALFAVDSLRRHGGIWSEVNGKRKSGDVCDRESLRRG